MNRRSFLKRMAAAVVATVAAVYCPSLAEVAAEPKTREQIIEEAMNCSDEDRIALAKAMVDPIRRSLERQALFYGDYDVHKNNQRRCLS